MSNSGVRAASVCAASLAQTVDSPVLLGVQAESKPDSVTLVDAENKRTTIARKDLEQYEPSAVSLMLEQQLDDLSPQQILDLFAYLQSDQPK